ncbi:MAG: thioredoxin domain-containing protein [Bacteroidota bacterium]
MKKLYLLILLSFIIVSCNNISNNKDVEANNKQSETVIVKPEHLDEVAFRTKVFDFTSGKEWNYLGDKPCIIDFYADWCSPCRRLAPILEELAQEYRGQIYIYKVNTEKNPNVSAYFGITSIPAVFFCPMNAQPQTMVGLYPKEDYVKVINEVLLKSVKK